MCGFSGFIDNIQNKKTVLESMMDEIIHRYSLGQLHQLDLSHKASE